LTFIEDPNLIKAYFYLKNDFPAKLYKKIASLPIIGNKKMLKDAVKLNEINKRA